MTELLLIAQGSDTVPLTLSVTKLPLTTVVQFLTISRKITEQEVAEHVTGRFMHDDSEFRKKIVHRLGGSTGSSFCARQEDRRFLKRPPCGQGKGKHFSF